jgi:hypothetical protein
MSLCTRCGKQIEIGQTCDCSADSTLKAAGAASLKYAGEARGFLESMKNRMGLDDPERNASDRYEHGQQIVPDSIKPNEGEIWVCRRVVLQWFSVAAESAGRIYRVE